MRRGNNLFLRFPPVFWVVLIGLLWVTVDFPGRLGGDSPARLKIAHALWTGEEEVTDGGLTQDEIKKFRPEEQRLRGFKGVLGKDGKLHYGYEVGQALIMIPADWLATKLYRFFPKQDEWYFKRHAVSFFTFFPLSLLIILSCYWLLLRLGFSRNLSALSSIIWLICTTAFNSIHNQQRENQILLLMMLGYLSILLCLSQKKQIFALLSGTCAGFAFIMRSDAILHVFCLFIFLFGSIFLSKEADKRVSPKPIIFWVMGFSLMFFLGRTIEYFRFGGFWDFVPALAMKQIRTAEYLSSLPQLPDNYPFINPFYMGIVGALLTPAKSIFIYDPLLLPGLLIGIFAWRKIFPAVKLFIACASLSLIMFIIVLAKFDFWHGDPAWGVRYHLISVQLMLIPLTAILIKKMIMASKKICMLVCLLLVLAFCIQFLSIVFRPSLESHRIYYATFKRFFDFRIAERIDNICFLVHSKYLGKELDKADQKRMDVLIEKLNLLPFCFGRKRLFVFYLWISVLFTALLITPWFVKKAMQEIREKEFG